MLSMKTMIGIVAIVMLTGCGEKVDHNQFVMQYTHDARTGLCFARASRPDSLYEDWGSTEVSCTDSVLILANKQRLGKGKKNEL